jgi:hypothetical protein
VSLELTQRPARLRPGGARVPWEGASEGGLREAARGFPDLACWRPAPELRVL